MKVTNRIAEYIVRDMRPISTVDGSGFHNLLRLVEPNYSVPSRTHITFVLRKMYFSVKEQVCKEVDSQYVALTTDLWNSNATKAYLTVTAHFIDNNWVIVSKVLQTREMPERHTTYWGQYCKQA